MISQALPFRWGRLKSAFGRNETAVHELNRGVQLYLRHRLS